MASWIFFNIEPEPDILLDYKDDFSEFRILARSSTMSLPLELIAVRNNERLRTLLLSKQGYRIRAAGYGEIILRLRRFLFKPRWKVMYNDVQLSGLKVA